eukprot:363891-Chlamydomonas_euryale.AAC.8
MRMRSKARWKNQAAGVLGSVRRRRPSDAFVHLQPAPACRPTPPSQGADRLRRTAAVYGSKPVARFQGRRGGAGNMRVAPACLCLRRTRTSPQACARFAIRRGGRRDLPARATTARAGAAARRPATAEDEEERIDRAIVEVLGLRRRVGEVADLARRGAPCRCGGSGGTRREGAVEVRRCGSPSQSTQGRALNRHFAAPLAPPLPCWCSSSPSPTFSTRRVALPRQLVSRVGAALAADAVEERSRRRAASHRRRGQSAPTATPTHCVKAHDIVIWGGGREMCDVQMEKLGVWKWFLLQLLGPPQHGARRLDIMVVRALLNMMVMIRRAPGLEILFEGAGACDVTTLDSPPNGADGVSPLIRHLNARQVQKEKEGTWAGKGTNKDTKRTQGMQDERGKDGKKQDPTKGEG